MFKILNCNYTTDGGLQVFDNYSKTCDVLPSVAASFFLFVWSFKS